MREQIEARLATLREEHTRGVAVLNQMNQERENLQQALLRIAGAMQVCQELLTQPGEVAEGVTDGNNR